jgi:hypothetical protein
VVADVTPDVAPDAAAQATEDAPGRAHHAHGLMGWTGIRQGRHGDVGK